MTRRTALIASALLLPVAPAAAQSWEGFYLGVYAGDQTRPDDSNDRIVFDTDLDGRFGDTVRTGAGADAFSPGFCDGVAQERTPAGGCAGNSGGAELGLRAGYDWQARGLVWGVVADYGSSDARDAVAAFSTTPARYTMLRKIDDVFALRGRVGIPVAGDDGLVFATAGYVRAGIDTHFETSNGVNTFVQSGGGSADGSQFGVGYEHRFGAHIALGVEYLFTRLDHDDSRVRAQGPAPATNPFLLVNSAGTDFARSDTDFDLESLRLSATYRF